MANTTKSGKPEKQPASGKARSRTIELTAKDVTPGGAKAKAGSKTRKTTSSKPRTKAAASSSTAKKSSTTAKKPTARAKKPTSTAKKPSAGTGKNDSQGVSRLAYVGSAVIGGGVALAGIVLLAMLGIIDFGGGAGIKITSLEKRIAGMEDRLSATGKSGKKTLEGLKAQIGDVAAKISANSSGLENTASTIKFLEKSKADEAALKALHAQMGKTGEALGALKKNAALAVNTLKDEIATARKAREGLAHKITAGAQDGGKRTSAIALLDGRIETSERVSQSLAMKMDNLLKGLQDIEKSIADTKDTSGNISSSAGVRLALLTRKLGRLEKEVTSLGQTLQSMPPSPPDFSPQIKVMEKAVGSLNSALNTYGGRDADRASMLKLVQDRMAIVEKTARRFASLNQRVDAISANISTLHQAINSANEALKTVNDRTDGGSEAMSALSARIDETKAGLEEKISELNKTASEALKVDEKLAGIDERIGVVRAVQEELARAQADAAGRVASDRFSKALLAGDPYAGLVKSFIAATPGKEIPEAIMQAAETGIPTRKSLVRDITALKTQFEAVNILEGGEGIAGRLMKSAGSVISIRRTGSVQGSGPASVASRIAAHIVAGDLDKAIKSAQEFSGQAAEKAAPWLKAAQLRLVAEQFAAGELMP